LNCKGIQGEETIMRIDLNQGPQAAPETRAGSVRNAPASSNSGASPLGEDQAQLSAMHAQAQALTAQAAQLPEIRQERVQALRQAVESGRYRVNSQQLAGAMVAHMVGA
jgi:flagellar biosynthesis anti-sigma factor FlgM